MHRHWRCLIKPQSAKQRAAQISWCQTTAVNHDISQRFDIGHARHIGTHRSIKIKIMAKRVLASCRIIAAHQIGMASTDKNHLEAIAKALCQIFHKPRHRISPKTAGTHIKPNGN